MTSASRAIQPSDDHFRIQIGEMLAHHGPEPLDSVSRHNATGIVGNQHATGDGVVAQPGYAWHRTEGGPHLFRYSTVSLDGAHPQPDTAWKDVGNMDVSAIRHGQFVSPTYSPTPWGHLTVLEDTC